jgi:hypothetical protein
MSGRVAGLLTDSEARQLLGQSLAIPEIKSAGSRLWILYKIKEVSNRLGGVRRQGSISGPFANLIVSLGMADGKDDGVEAGRRLGEEARQLRHKRRDEGPVSEAGDHDDNGIWRPDTGPQAHIRDGHLCDADLGTFCLGIL